MAKLGGPGVEIRGLRDFQRDLRSLGSEWPKELRRQLKQAAELVAERARQRARAEGGVLAKAAPSIKATAEQRNAKIAWGGARQPYSTGAVMGAKQYPQFRDWVGNAWTVGQRGQGPYAINDAVADTDTELVEAVGDALEDVAARAFPKHF